MIFTSLLLAAIVQKLDPVTTRVVILPTLSTTGDKFVEMVENQRKEGDKTLVRLFSERKFNVAPLEDGKAAFDSAKIDFSDEENQRKDVLFKIGEDAKADILVFTIITRTWNKSTEGFLTVKAEGFATLKTWVLDVKNKIAILPGKSIEGVSSMNSPAMSARQIRAVRVGMENQLKEFLAGFPK